jgi:hypothetical protein
MERLLDNVSTRRKGAMALGGVRDCQACNTTFLNLTGLWL